MKRVFEKSVLFVDNLYNLPFFLITSGLFTVGIFELRLPSKTKGATTSVVPAKYLTVMFAPFVDL